MVEKISQKMHLILLVTISGSVFGGTIRDAEICETKTCLEIAKSIIANMDETMDPCVDFYQYACGNYMKDKPVPANLDRILPLRQLDLQVEEQVKQVIAKIKKDDIQPFQKVSQYYKTCIDEGKLDGHSERELLELLKSAGGWPVLERSWNEANFSWEKIIYLLYASGISHNTLINAFYSADFKNDNIVTIHIDEPVFKLPAQVLANGLIDLRVQQYFSFIVDIAVILGSNPTRAEEELKQAVYFEIELARMSSQIDSKRDLIEAHQPTTIADLQKKCSIVSWVEYLTKTLRPPGQLQVSERILVASSGFVQKLCTKMKGTPKRVLANYIFYTLVTEFSTQLSSRLRNRATKFSSEIGSGSAFPRWKVCLATLRGQMHLATSALFVRRVLKKETKTDALQIVHFIRKRIQHSLEHNNWMDPATKKSAIDKLVAMKSLIAYPDELLDDNKLNDFYKDLTVNPDSFVKTILGINRFAQKRYSTMYKKPMSKFDWTGSFGMVATVNGFYNPNENSFVLFGGLLQEPFFDATSPRYINFAGLGSFVGHEMTHGFDDLGRRFDKEGGYHNWWKLGTEKKFVEKSKCFIKQYELYELAENIKMNGSLTLGENIADNGGLKQAYLSYKDWETLNPKPEPRLAGLTKFSQKQMFWLSYANTWCSKLRPGPISFQLLYDTHSPSHLRVKIPLMNIPDFALDYKCPKGSPMNPEKKCHVW
ncbi:hypothetical protein QAD02_006091 [Eretmocerus hayati]|uniref:Uncharacterized protein n=1 Tax=Eretmocerus hayati TaxID=131215 RepID=A0ACC2N2A6_9HYME|nr:hypothetical protein QAD02_006091 [Eretmocerus hayati]